MHRPVHMKKHASLGATLVMVISASSCSTSNRSSSLAAQDEVSCEVAVDALAPEEETAFAAPPDAMSSFCDQQRVKVYQTDPTQLDCEKAAYKQGDDGCHALNCPSVNHRSVGQICNPPGPWVCFGWEKPGTGQMCPGGANNCYAKCNACSTALDCSYQAGFICCPNGTCKAVC